MLKNLSERVLETFHELDRAVFEVHSEAMLFCPTGCGVCCLSSKMRTTVLEALPIAFELAGSGKAEQWLGLLETHKGSTPCTFYKKDSRDGKRGHCTVYHLRPGMCRLLGYAAEQNKQGSFEISICAAQEESDSDAAMRARELARQGGVPLFSEWRERLAKLEPRLGTEQLPINEAIATALRKVLSGSFPDGNDEPAPVAA